MEAVQGAIGLSCSAAAPLGLGTVQLDRCLEHQFYSPFSSSVHGCLELERSSMTRLVAVLVVVHSFSPCGAQSAGAEPELRNGVQAEFDSLAYQLERLRNAPTFRCSFPGYGSELVIDAVSWQEDPDSRVWFGSARFIGNIGSSQLLGILGDNTISFLEIVPSGAVNLITVYNDEVVEEPTTEFRPGGLRYQAVWSRHTRVVGPTPSQTQGYCSALY